MPIVKIIKFWLPVLLCMGLIFYAGSIPGSDIPPLFPYQDIVFHFFIYLALTYSFARALKNTYSTITMPKIVFFALIFGVIYGLSDEFHQSFVPYRYASRFDVFIDSVGSMAGSLIYPGLKRS